MKCAATVHLGKILQHMVAWNNPCRNVQKSHIPYGAPNKLFSVEVSRRFHGSIAFNEGVLSETINHWTIPRCKLPAYLRILISGLEY